MVAKSKSLYLLLFVACTAGYIWMFFALQAAFNLPEVCLFKQVTHIPCPSCGATRALVAVIQGNFWEAFVINPFAYLIAFILVVAPIWIGWDISVKKNTLFAFYLKIEQKLQNYKLAIPLVMLVVLNWVWNISKGL